MEHLPDKREDAMHHSECNLREGGMCNCDGNYAFAKLNDRRLKPQGDDDIRFSHEWPNVIIKKLSLWQVADPIIKAVLIVSSLLIVFLIMLLSYYLGGRR